MEKFVMPEGKSLCFSGHRPEGFHSLAVNGFTDNDVVMCIQSGLYDLIYESIRDGYVNFICGMAPGVDFWAAKLVLEVSQRDFPGVEVRLIAALPFPGFTPAKTEPGISQFARVMQSAYSVATISSHYHRLCFALRNQFMVDHSERLIAAVVNYRSGTGQTIRLARERGVEVVLLNLDECVRPYKPPEPSV